MPFLPSLLLLIAGQSLFAAECPKDAAAWAKWRKVTLVAAKSLNELSEAGQFIAKCEADPLTASPFSDPLLGACLSPLKRFGAGYQWDDRRGETLRPAFEYADEELALLGGLPKENNLHGTEAESGAGEIKPNQLDPEALGKLLAKFSGAKAVKRNGSLIVVLPGKKADRWYNLNPFGIMQLDIVKQDENGKALTKPMTYFTDNPFGKNAGKAEVAACTKCHMTGAVPMLTETNSAGKFSQTFAKQNVEATVQAMTKIAKQTANAIPSVVNSDDYGPPYGPKNPAERTDTFLGQCAKTPGLEKAVASRLKDNMNCASCHNGVRSSVLNVPIGVGEKVTEGVLASGHMPPGGDKSLSAAERGMLRDCLLQEYYGTLQGGDKPGIFQKWLNSPACPAEPEEMKSAAVQDVGN